MSLPRDSLEFHPRKVFGLALILKSMRGRYRRRSILALMLMIAQSFLYNSVFFTFGLILAHFYRVPDQQVGLYLLLLAIGNFCGPLMLGSLFDTVGRKKMIAGTFAISGVFLRVTAHVFGAGRQLPKQSRGLRYSFLHLRQPVPLISRQAKYFPSKLARWLLPVFTRLVPPLAAALRRYPMLTRQADPDSISQPNKSHR
jgi:MFS family permease